MDEIMVVMAEGAMSHWCRARLIPTRLPLVDWFTLLWQIANEGPVSWRSYRERHGTNTTYDAHGYSTGLMAHRPIWCVSLTAEQLDAPRIHLHKLSYPDIVFRPIKSHYLLRGMPNWDLLYGGPNGTPKFYQPELFTLELLHVSA